MTYLMLFKTVVKKLNDGTWLWEVSRYGKPLQNGTAKTEKQAKAAVQAAAGKLVVESNTLTSERHKVKLRFKFRVQGRPFLALHVVGSFAQGLEENYILGEAEAEEADLHRRVTGKQLVTGKGPRKPAAEMAQLMLEDMKLLGWDAKKAEAWGAKYIGDAFTAFLDGNLPR